MKITRSQLRQIIQESVITDYGERMDQVDMLLNGVKFDGRRIANVDTLIDSLLKIVGSSGDFETEEARAAIISLEDVRSEEAIVSKTSDVENYIRDALRSQVIK